MKGLQKLSLQKRKHIEDDSFNIAQTAKRCLELWFHGDIKNCHENCEIAKLARKNTV